MLLKLVVEDMLKFKDMRLVEKLVHQNQGLATNQKGMLHHLLL